MEMEYSRFSLFVRAGVYIHFYIGYVANVTYAFYIASSSSLGSSRRIGEDSRMRRDLEREVVKVRWESLWLRLRMPRRAGRGLEIEIDSSSISEVDGSSSEADCTD